MKYKYSNSRLILEILGAEPVEGALSIQRVVMIQDIYAMSKSPSQRKKLLRFLLDDRFFSGGPSDRDINADSRSTKPQLDIEISIMEFEELHPSIELLLNANKRPRPEKDK